MMRNVCRIFVKFLKFADVDRRPFKPKIDTLSASVEYFQNAHFNVDFFTFSTF